MEQQRTWTSCYDVLSSLVSSHGTVLVNCQEFSIDSFGWPSLQESALKCCRQGNSTYQDEFDWTLCELDASEFQECVQTSHEDIPETTDFEGLKTETADMNKSWEVIEVINGGGEILIKTEILPLAGQSKCDECRYYNFCFLSYGSLPFIPIHNCMIILLRTVIVK